MADTHDKKTRSYNMSQIKGKNTKPEILVRKFLFAKGFRFKLHDKKLAGKPDIVLPKHKTVVNVHGCFWHGHKKASCKDSRLPKSNLKYWRNKICSNQKRDFNNEKLLMKAGWNAITVWTCQLTLEKKEKTLNKIVEKILKQNP